MSDRSVDADIDSSGTAGLQPVMPSRLPRVAVLATVVVALVVLAIVVPRLTPQPPPPTSTPASPLVPTPIPVVPGTVACTGDGIPVTLDDRTGTVGGCQLLSPGLGAIGQSPAATNEGGDRSHVRVMWGTSACVTGVAARFARDASGEPRYTLAITEYQPACYGPPASAGFELELRSEIDASAVTIAFTQPQATPSPQPSSGQFVCGQGPVLVDETGLVQGCATAQYQATDELPVTVSNPNGDMSLLEVGWSGCNGPDRLTLRATWGGYELVALNSLPGNVICAGPPFRTRLELRVSAPIDAQTVTVSNSRPPPATITKQCTSNGGPPLLVIDRGLVANCTTTTFSPVNDVESQPTVDNPDGDTSTLHVLWRSTGCVRLRTVDLDLSSQPYQLRIWETPGPDVCKGPLATTAGFELDLNQPVPADQVTVILLALDRDLSRL